MKKSFLATCEKIISTKTKTYLELKTYDKKGLFKKIKCVLENPLIRQTKQKFYKGAWVSVEKSRVVKDKEDKDLCSILEYKIVSESVYFPSEHKKNELKDVELRYKNKLKDLLLNDQSLQVLNSRYLIIEKIKQFFKKKNYLLVDLPILEMNYGGAVAKPFETYMKDAKKKFYLRISFEFQLLKHITVGFPSVFSLGSVFRNQCITRKHLPEFTLLQSMTTDRKKDLCYHTKLVEQLYHKLFFEANGSHYKHNKDLRKPWRIYHKQEIDFLCNKHGLPTLQDLQKNKILEPFHHITGYDFPLAKNENQRIESFVDYEIELAHFYDQVVSLSEFKEKKVLESEDQKDLISEDFKECVNYGLPPTFGFGLGIERLILSVLNEKINSVRQLSFAPVY